MHKILVPIDGSVHALKALHIACDLVEKYDGHISLLHVLDVGKPAHKILSLMVAKNFPAKLKTTLGAEAETPSGLIKTQTLIAVGHKILEQAAHKIHHRGLDFDTLRIEEGDPVEAILIAIKRTGANTVVLGSRGVSDSAESAFGSVSHRVFQRAECTCLAVK